MSELLGSPGPTLCLPENIIVINLIVRARMIIMKKMVTMSNVTKVAWTDILRAFTAAA